MSTTNFSPDKSSIAVFPGGGTQGMISAFLATEFENKSGRAFHENFTQVEGLSVGSLNASCLWPLRATGEPPMAAADLKDIYLTRISDAFDYNLLSLNGLLTNKYDVSGLEKLIDDIFGDRKLSDYADGLHIYVETKQLRTLKSEDAAKDPTEDFYMRDLLRSAVSAPFFFKPVAIKNIAGQDVKFVDAGLFSSDPSFKAYFDAQHTMGDNTNIIMTVFGTGHKNTEAVTLDDLDGGVGKIGHMLSVMFKSKANTFDDMLRKAMGEDYVRMDVDISNSGLDMIADDIEDVIPYAEKAVAENQENMLRSLNNIRRLETRNENIMPTPAENMPENVIPFPAFALQQPEAACG